MLKNNFFSQKVLNLDFSNYVEKTMFQGKWECY